MAPSRLCIAPYVGCWSLADGFAGIADLDLNTLLDDDTYLTIGADSFTVTFTFSEIVQNYQRTDGPAFKCGLYSTSGQGAIDG